MKEDSIGVVLECTLCKNHCSNPVELGLQCQRSHRNWLANSLPISPLPDPRADSEIVTADNPQEHTQFVEDECRSTHAASSRLFLGHQEGHVEVNTAAEDVGITEEHYYPAFYEVDLPECNTENVSGTVFNFFK